MATDVLTARYEFQPLDTEWNIRLLEIFPGQENEPIQCSLERAISNTNPDHIALSYTWGDVKDRRLISIDDYQLSVTANLYSAIYRIRCIGDRRPLWASILDGEQLDLLYL